MDKDEFNNRLLAGSINKAIIYDDLVACTGVDVDIPSVVSDDVLIKELEKRLIFQGILLPPKDETTKKLFDLEN